MDIRKIFMILQKRIRTKIFITKIKPKNYQKYIDIYTKNFLDIYLKLKKLFLLIFEMSKNYDIFYGKFSQNILKLIPLINNVFNIIF
jgi:hypothetical protein